MRIAMIGQKGIPAKFGGVETHVHDLSIRLTKEGHRVTAYSRYWYTTKGSSFVKGVLSKVLPSIETKHFDTISHTFLATLDAIQSKHDVIHYHGVGPALLSWIPRVFSPETTVVTTFHAIDRKQVKWGRFAKLMLTIGELAAVTFAHTTIAVSRTIKQYIKDTYNVDATYVPNGVPDYAKSRNLSALQTWNLAPQEYIVNVSRLIPDKGIDYLIKAFINIKTQHPDVLKNKKLVIVGDGYNTDDYVQSLHDLAEGHEDIIFTGFQTGDTLHQLFSHAALMVHPSDQEGLPIAVLEGMAFGLPVLVSDIPQHKELISDKQFIFTQSNISSLQEKLVNLITTNKMRLHSVGVANKKRVYNEYDWKAIVAKTSRVYKKALQNKPTKYKGLEGLVSRKS